MSTRIADPRLPVPAEGLSRRDLLSIAWRNDGELRDGHWIRVHRRAMACRFEITLSGERAAEIPAAREALEEAERLEALLSVFRETSEISRINQQAGIGAIAASNDVVALLSRCRQLSAATGGAFDITSTPLSRCWGFLRRDGRVPADSEIDQALALVGMDHLSSTSTTNRRVDVDAGRRGQPRRRRQGLRRAGDRRRALAPRRARSAGLRRQQLDPRARRHGRRVEGGRDGDEPDAARARAPAAAQRGARHQRRRRAVRRGQRPPVRPHPRSPHRRPASGVVNATVISADAATADALATAFFVGGIELARAYCDAHPARSRSSPRTTSPGVLASSGATAAPLVEEL